MRLNTITLLENITMITIDNRAVEGATYFTTATKCLRCYCENCSESSVGRTVYEARLGLAMGMTGGIKTIEDAAAGNHAAVKRLAKRNGMTYDDLQGNFAIAGVRAMEREANRMGFELHEFAEIEDALGAALFDPAAITCIASLFEAHN